jgi:hypothetical protein
MPTNEQIDSDVASMAIQDGLAELEAVLAVATLQLDALATLLRARASGSIVLVNDNIVGTMHESAKVLEKLADEITKGGCGASRVYWN